MRMYRRLGLAAVVALLGSNLLAQDRIEGDYVGILALWRMQPTRAELRIEKAGRKVKGQLRMRVFAEEIDTTRSEAACELGGSYSSDARQGQFLCEKWLTRQPPDIDFRLDQVSFDPGQQKIVGNGFEFVRSGSAAAAAMQSNLEMSEAIAVQRRLAEDALAKRTGEYQRARNRIAARDVQEQNASRPGVELRTAKSAGRVFQTNGDERCALIAAWLAPLTRDVPYGLATGGAGRQAGYVVFASAFRDEMFVPLFGIRYDGTTPAWREQVYQERLRPCLGSAGKPYSGTLNSYSQLLTVAFGNFTYETQSSELLVAVQQNRRSRAAADSILALPVPGGPEAFRELSVRISDIELLKVLAPAEVAAARDSINVFRRAAAPAATERWSAALLRGPDSFEKAERIATALRRAPEFLDFLKPAERDRSVRALNAGLQRMVDALVEVRLARLATLTATDAGITEAARWCDDLQTQVERLPNARLDAALAQGRDVRERLFDARFPGFIADLNALPRSSAGLARARRTFAEIFPTLARRPPAYTKYAAAVATFQSRLLADMRRIIESDTTVTPAARLAYADVATADRLPGRRLLAEIGTVDLRMDVSGDSSRLWNAAGVALGQLRVPAKLRTVGVTVQPVGTAQLSISLGSKQHRVTSSTQSQEVQTITTTIWGTARLAMPLLVVRSAGVVRTDAVVATSAFSRSETGETISSAAIESLMDDLIDGLTVDAVSRDSIAAPDDEWREHYLDGAGEIGRWHADFVQSTRIRATSPAQRFAGVRTLAPVEFGIGPFNQSLYVDIGTKVLETFGLDFLKFDPRSFWEGGVAAAGWRLESGSRLTQPVAVHLLGARPLGVHSLGFQSTVQFTRLQFAAIREPSCLISNRGRTHRVSCYTASTFTVGFGTKALPDGAQARQTVDALFRAVNSGAP